MNVHQLLDPLKVTNILLEQTKDNDMIIKGKLSRQLVSLLTMSIIKNPELIKPIRQKARTKLRILFPRTLVDNSYSLKLRVMMFMGAYVPSIYELVYTIYEKITGLEKI